MKAIQKALMVIFKDFSIEHTITSLAKELGVTRVGAWKILKKLEFDNLIILNPISSGKTSTYIVKLNWDNILTLKNIEISLTEEAMKSQRWLNNFIELEKKVDFLIIYGSILHSPKEASDIDILSVCSKNKFTEINEVINKIQKIQERKIHALNFTEEEFKKELSNKAFIDAIKRGIVLFGQEKFIKFLKGVKS